MNFMAGKVLGTLAFAQAKQEMTSVNFRYYAGPLLSLTKKLLEDVGSDDQTFSIYGRWGTSCSNVTRESFCS